MRTGPTWLLGLLPLVLTVPALPVVAGAFGARALHQSAPAVRRVVARFSFAFVVRGILVAVFLAAFTQLFQTIRALT